MANTRKDYLVSELNPAVERGDLDEVKKIIEAHKDLKPNSLTVAKAIVSGNIELLKYFQDKFAMTPANLGQNDLNYAIKKIKSHEMFNHLLTSYRGMRFGLNEETTWIVARSGNLENLKLLLSIRIPPATSGTLFEAVNSGNLDCVKFLVEDYKIDGVLIITDYKESLEHAETKGQTDIATYLKSKMPKQTDNQIESIGSSIRNSVQLPTKQQPLPSPEEKELFEACKNFRSDDVKKLLDNKISPNIRDSEGNTPIFYAAKNCDFDSVDHLCAAGADVNLKNKNDETPLIYAYQNRRSEIPLQLLLAKGANPYIPVKSGNIFTIAKKNEYRITELRALEEWEDSNYAVAKKLRIETEKSMTSQTPQSQIVAKPFVTSPIHTAQTIPVKKEEKLGSTSVSEKSNVNLTYGHLNIIFENKVDSQDWRLEILNNEKSMGSQYSMLFSSKESISTIKKYLQENNISSFIDFIETKGSSAMKISQYLRNEIKNVDSSKFKPSNKY